MNNKEYKQTDSNKKIQTKAEEISAKSDAQKESSNNQSSTKPNDEITFFGHKEEENIYDCFLTNTLFAHRGFWDKECPENSIGAFKQAIEKGYGIELDVSPIADGTPVVFHDSKLSRMTGKDGYIQNLTKS